MSDIRIKYDPESMTFDFAIANGDLELDDGLETSVIISLFTDRRAEDDDKLPDGGSDRRGWWGDAFAQIQGDKIGSRLWLLSREKETSKVLSLAKRYAEEALHWMVEDGIARSVIVRTSIPREGVLGLEIEIQRAGKPVSRFRFEQFWRGS